MFSSGKCTRSQMNYFIHIKYNTFYRHWNSSHNKKNHDFFLFTFFTLLFFYSQVLTHSLFTFTLSIWPWRQSCISQIAFASLSKDKKASFGRMFKSPRLLLKKKKNSLKMLVLIQCLWLRHGTMLKGWIWKKKNRIKD